MPWATLGSAPPVTSGTRRSSISECVTQAPITSFIIVMEMVGGHAMVLSLMAAALGASLVSRWIARPLYAALAQAIVARVRAGTPVPVVAAP